LYRCASEIRLKLSCLQSRGPGETTCLNAGVIVNSHPILAKSKAFSLQQKGTS
jgi:hypothetical protein